MQTRWSFDSKPTLLCWQLYAEVTVNFIHCLLLSKLKLGLELKQKNEILTVWSFDSKPTLLCLQRDFEATGNAIHCLLLSKLKLGLELKQKYSPKPQIPNNSYPTFLERKNALFHYCGIWGVGEARFRVKTKVTPEVTNYEQFLPHISGVAEYIFFP